jgi:glutamate-1-semialdehyde 2,1-aminomutase
MRHPTDRVLTKSNMQFQRALKRLPLGVSSNFRYWGDDRTIYAQYAKGGRIWDIDDNSYVDYRLAFGPTILGYADDRVDAAARKGMEVGGVFALSTERELIVAERIAKMVPAAELVRFSNSGTEAVMAALRLARAYTGRESYLLVEGGYHGLFDAAMWQLNMEDWDPNSKTDPDLVTHGRGVPSTLRQLVHISPMNDCQRLEDIFKSHGDKLAAMLIEPIQGNCSSIMARPDYLFVARELCTKYGVMLIIDEVKSGFRVGKSGIQGIMGVAPDITTFAKAMANGYPISVVAGREEVMRTFGVGGASHGGTYTAHSVSLAAAEETLRILDETPALESVAAYGESLKAGISQILDSRGITHSFTGHPSMFGIFFTEFPPDNFRTWKMSDFSFYNKMAYFLHDLNIIVDPDSDEPWFICESHGEDSSCLTDTLKAIEIAVDLTLEHFEDAQKKI